MGGVRSPQEEELLRHCHPLHSPPYQVLMGHLPVTLNIPVTSSGNRLPPPRVSAIILLYIVSNQ